ncbi:hypothetical protein K438DRAFT_523452 [Mycena galopus ATCC 62051]|nr:hypothetical protein K438DRAFT_523452 [Mycena galopus ATCC 62051]
MSDKPLKLDPGPGPRKVRKTSLCSLCKCLCWTISIPLFCLAIWTAGSFGIHAVQETRFPHKSLYHAQSSFDSRDVIRPLITDQDTFDIAVSVWLRAPEDEEAESRRANLENTPTTTPEEAPAPTQLDLDGLGKVWVGLKVAEGNDKFRDEYILEKPLFSDVVFRGLRLSDRHASAKVDFRLPMARFLSPKLTESDLRATFLLVPSSPSLIDHVKKFSSWMPDSVFAKRRPTRPWPFPLGSEERSEKTVADLALESFSTSVPLIEFHDAASRCINVPSAPEVVVGHPYVVARTQLRIVRETNLFNATAYNAVRNEIKIHSCGQGIPGIKPNLKMCRRTYKSNGNFETLLELEVPTESGVETQWAYAPYLDTKDHATGPLDIIPLPVNRENCASTPADQGSDFMDVSWRIAFAGRTPGKQIMADNFVSPQLVDHRASELRKLSQQDEAELWNGLLGHRFHDDAHPRRRIFIQIVSGGCLLLYGLLLSYYWWTRVSTVGISVSGVAFAATGFLLGPIIETLQSDDPSLVFMLPMTVIVPYFMCKCVTRVDFEWKRWPIRIHPPSHTERTNQRMDNRTPWATKLGLFIALLAVYQLTDPENIYLIPTTVPAPTTEEYPQSRLFDFLRNVYHALCFMGTLCQVLLNHRYRAYGGGFRAEVVMFFLANVIGLLYFVPAVVGRMEMRQGLTPITLINLGIQLPLLWQALTLPPVEVKDVDEE